MAQGIGMGICALLSVAAASGCATTRTLEGGMTEVVYNAPRASEMPERLAGGATGMLAGALGGAGAALLLTGGEPEAALYVSVVTVPVCAFIGLAAGIGNPALVSNGALKVGVQSSTPVAAYSPEISPTVQALVRSAAYTAKYQYSRRRK